MERNKKLHKRIVDISYKKGLSHIGSCLTAVDIIDHIYDLMQDNDIFLLSSGHAGLALYVVLEDRFGYDAEMLFDKHGVHPNRDEEYGIYTSAGSLGHGLGIGLGMALADQSRNVYVLSSDGESAEGTTWETLRLAKRLGIRNLRVHFNVNGYSAYDWIDKTSLERELNSINYHFVYIHFTHLNGYPDFLQHLSGHYHVLNSEQYNNVKDTLDLA